MARSRFTQVLTSVALLAGGVVGGATVATALAPRTSAAPVTYYACLKSGTLTKVASKAETCPNYSYKLIFWSQVGPQGKPGTNGTNGKNGVAYNCAAKPYPGIDLSACKVTGAAGALSSSTGSVGHIRRAHSGNLAGQNLAGALLTEADMTGDNLSASDLTGADIAGSNLSNATLTGTILTGSNLAAANLSGAVITGANVSGANMSDAILTGLVSGSVQGTANSLPSDWSQVDGYFVGPSANLAGANLNGATMYLSSNGGVFFDLSGANLANADLSNTLWDNNKVVGANLTGANMANGSFVNVDFTNANLTDANLTGAGLGSATLTNVTWSNTTCPDGTNSNTDGDTCVNHGA